MPPVDLETALREGAAVLAAAGVGPARAEMEILAAHLLGLPRGELRVHALLGRPAPAGLSELVARRASREPLQHLTGRAPFREIELEVGPGVFVPRPETEQVAQVAISAARTALAEAGHVLVVDLCTGSGAIALAVAHEVPGSQVVGVELDAGAVAWARRNADRLADVGAAVRMVRGDARTALRELDGSVDVVASNPPYIPPDAVPVDPEVRDHDPAVALYGLGPDGLAVPTGVIGAAARLLRPGGTFVMEHAEVQAGAVRALVEADGRFTEVRTAPDLTGRDRMVVAVRVDPSPRAGVKDSRP
ncbi:MAG TPA: peptide chain release factor N(5)-glutamine methyltransferase [Actinotalea sp.]